MPKMHIPYPIPSSTTLRYDYKEWKCFKKQRIAEHFIPVPLFAIAASKKLLKSEEVNKAKNKSENKASVKKSFLDSLKQR